MNSNPSNRRERQKRDVQPRRKGSSGSQRILYDANGVRIKGSRIPMKLKRALLFYVLPYIVLNGLIFFLVTATPNVDMRVLDTSDYRHTQVEFEIKSLLPISELSVNMESEPLEYEEASRHHYICDIDQNGMLYVTVKSWNGMQTTNYVDVSVLDDTAPSIDEETCVISEGYLTFTIEDSQSGVDFDSIYGIYDGDKQVKPIRMDTATGTVTIPMYSDTIELHFEDLVGNARMGTISATMDYEDIEEDAQEETQTEAETGSGASEDQTDEEA